MRYLRPIHLAPFISLAFTTINAGGYDSGRSVLNIDLRHQEVVDDEWGDLFDESSYGNETTVSPAPSVAPSSNTTIVSPSPSVTPTPSPSNETVTPTTLPPTTAPPVTAPPTQAPPTPTHHPHHKWWENLWKVLLKTLGWMLVAGLFFFAFGAIMSNRYRIYFYLRGFWYSFLQKLKWSRRNGRNESFSNGSAPSSTLNDIIFSSDNEMQEGLLMRET